MKKLAITILLAASISCLALGQSIEYNPNEAGTTVNSVNLPFGSSTYTLSESVYQGSVFKESSSDPDFNIEMHEVAFEFTGGTGEKYANVTIWLKAFDASEYNNFHTLFAKKKAENMYFEFTDDDIYYQSDNTRYCGIEKDSNNHGYLAFHFNQKNADNTLKAFRFNTSQCLLMAISSQTPGNGSLTYLLKPNGCSTFRTHQSKTDYNSITNRTYNGTLVTNGYVPCTNFTSTTFIQTDTTFLNNVAQDLEDGKDWLNIVLPIELIEFTASANESSIDLSWATATEKDNDYFSLQRSSDAINFSEIARVKGAGNSIVENSYSFTDWNAYHGDNYYRLVQVDYDGTSSTSEIIVAKCKSISANTPTVDVYPNPASESINISLNNFGDKVEITIFDITGRIVMEKCVTAIGTTTLDISSLAKSTYTLQVKSNDNVSTQIFMKN